MHFTVNAVSPEQFSQWVSAARGGGPSLDAAAYADLAKPSKAVAPFTYRAVATNLFSGILQSGTSADAFPRFACSTSQRVEK
jgi:cytochrome o ubiquinol oxidase subunit 2